MTTAPITVSVVALTWNSERFVPAFLDSLLADVEGAPFATEIFVVDNGSTDGTPELLASYVAKSPNVLRLIRLPKNQGTTVTRNLALRQVRGEFVLIIDSDVQVPSGTLEGLVNGFRAGLPDSERVGLVCPQLVYPDGEFQESARRFPTVITKALRLLKSEKLRRWDESIPDVFARRATLVDYAISAAWFIPRTVFDEVGYLDERIFFAPEDVEFCARLWRAGFSVWYYPSVTIIHDCQRLTNKKPFTRLGLSHLAGLVHYWREYQGFFSRPKRFQNR